MLFWDRWRIAGSRGRFLLLGEFDDVAGFFQVYLRLDLAICLAWGCYSRARVREAFIEIENNTNNTEQTYKNILGLTSFYLLCLKYSSILKSVSKLAVSFRLIEKWHLLS